MGGAVRGAIAFGLINGVSSKEKELLKMTVLGLVIITTVVMGAILPYWV